MKKWQELCLNAILNICSALIVGGFLKLMLDDGDIKTSLSISLFGICGFCYAVITIKNIEEKDKK